MICTGHIIIASSISLESVFFAVINYLSITIMEVFYGQQRKQGGLNKSLKLIFVYKTVRKARSFAEWDV